MSQSYVNVFIVCSDSTLRNVCVKSLYMFEVDEEIVFTILPT